MVQKLSVWTEVGNAIGWNGNNTDGAGGCYELAGVDRGAACQGQALFCPYSQVTGIDDGGGLGSVLQTRCEVDRQKGWSLRIHGAELAAVGEEETVSGAGDKGTSDIQLRSIAKDDAIGVEEEEVGAAVDTK